MRHAGSHDKGNGRSFAFVAQRTWSAANLVGRDSPDTRSGKKSRIWIGRQTKARRGFSDRRHRDEDYFDDLCARAKRRNTLAGFRAKTLFRCVKFPGDLALCRQRAERQAPRAKFVSLGRTAALGPLGGPCRFSSKALVLRWSEAKPRENETKERQASHSCATPLP